MKKIGSVFIGILVLLICADFEHSSSAIGWPNDWDQRNGSVKSYPPGFTFVEVPDPLSANNPLYPLVAMSEPNVGVLFKDHHFKTDLIRVTQRGKIRHEYSRFDPFNRDQSMIVLQNIDSGDFLVYRTNSMPYEQSGNLVRNLSNIHEDPRWDPNDPNLIWGLRDFSIITVNVQTSAETVIKDFSSDATIGPVVNAEPDLYRITMRQEGESSRDKRYWAFFLQGTLYDYRLRYIFTWDRQLDKVLGLYQISAVESEVDWVSMSPLGNFVVVGGDVGNGGNFPGLTMCNRELTRFHLLESHAGHADVGLDISGNEVIVIQNTRTDYIEMIPISWDTPSSIGTRGSSKAATRTNLVLLFYSPGSPHGLVDLGVHISCNCAGYCVISTHQDQNEPERNWLHRTNILVKLDQNNPRAFYLSKIYNTCQEYWEETHATMTNDGSKIIWASNWGSSIGQEQIFLMQLNMPSIWIKDDILGTWRGSGVWYRNSETGSWRHLSTPADLVVAGDLDGDGIDDLIGVWSSGLWVKYSSSGSWAKLSTTIPTDIASGDMNGDGRDDILGSWASGVWYRNSDTGSWVKVTTSAQLVTAGDLDGDGADDLIGVWSSGLWVKYSSTNKWLLVTSVHPTGIASGDMNGDGRDDILGIWSSGVWYWCPVCSAWVKMSTPANLVAAGDIDGDGTDDLIGTWSSGLWVKNSSATSWQFICTSLPIDIDAGLFRTGWGTGEMSYDTPIAGVYAEGPGNIDDYKDLTGEGPGGWNFIYQEEENLIPKEKGMNIMRVPGPGEPGFKGIEQKNLIAKESLDKKRRVK